MCFSKTYTKKTCTLNMTCCFSNKKNMAKNICFGRKIKTNGFIEKF